MAAAFIWTGMTTFVREEMRPAVCAVSIHHVSGSISTSTGFAPRRIAASAQEIIVKDGITTSSPRPTPSAYSAVSRAAVPLLTATPWAQPRQDAKACSNLATKGPSDDIQPESMHSAKYRFSFPERSGSLTGIKLVFSHSLNPLGRLARNSGFVRIAGIRALLDLEHLHRFQRFKTMPS